MADNSTGPGGGQAGGSEKKFALPGKFLRLKRAVDRALEESLPSGEGYAEAVVEAMRYSLSAPGKRIRPVLTMLSAEVAGGKPEGVMDAAVAVEMVHTASLILDDLPCMDNAELRRGRPALHHHADEAAAILAADALLMRAFSLLGRAVSTSPLSAADAGGLISDAADCVGVHGMIGGQWRDLHPSGPDLESLEYVHSHKTGRLFILSATLGARLGGAPAKTVECLAGYAKNLGLAFQIIDDILDRESTSRELGKDTGADRGRVTFVTAFGTGPAREVAGELIQTARDSLEPFGTGARWLLELADYVYYRRK